MKLLFSPSAKKRSASELKAEERRLQRERLQRRETITRETLFHIRSTLGSPSQWKANRVTKVTRAEPSSIYVPFWMKHSSLDLEYYSKCADDQQRLAIIQDDVAFFQEVVRKEADDRYPQWFFFYEYNKEGFPSGIRLKKKN